MNSSLLFINNTAGNIGLIVGLSGILLAGILTAFASNTRSIKSVFILLTGSIFMISSSIIIKTLAPETTKQQAVQSEVKDDDSMIKNEREQQEITVEWYSDEDDSQDLAKMIALIIGIVLVTIIVIFVIYILKEKNKNTLEFLKTCNLSDLSQEELEKYLKWLFCNRKSFSVLLAEAIFADRGIFADSGINLEIYELEEKIKMELERRNDIPDRKVPEFFDEEVFHDRT